MGASANVRGTGFEMQDAGGRIARRSPLPPVPSPPRQGFTLVEMLVVITIIGILASLITAAAIMARARARRAMVRAEIGQLELALTSYKQEVGEFPPDFANTDPTLTEQYNKDARAAVVRHLRKRFPRYQPGLTRTGTAADTSDSDVVYNAFCADVSWQYTATNPAQFDAASGLVFWLGGLPETATGGNRAPAGFHANVQFPFATGLPRTKPLFEFDPARLEVATGGSPFAFYTSTDPSLPPYVYFRARRLMNAAGQYEFGFVHSNEFYPLSYPRYGATPVNNWGRAVPYLDGQIPDDPRLPATQRVWRNQDTFQIIFGGFDNTFGSNDLNFRFSRLGQQIGLAGGTTGTTMDASNFDNITNFTTDTLEAEMQE